MSGCTKFWHTSVERACVLICRWMFKPPLFKFGSGRSYSRFPWARRVRINRLPRRSENRKQCAQWRGRARAITRRSSFPAIASSARTKVWAVIDGDWNESESCWTVNAPSLNPRLVRDLRRLDPHRLDIHELANAEMAQLPSVTGALHAAERQTRI